MLTAAVVAILGIAQQAGPGDLEVAVTVQPEAPVVGEPVKIRTSVKYTGSKLGVLLDGLRMRAPDVLVAEVRGKTAGEYSRVDRGKDGGPAHQQIALSPGGTYERHDVLSENLKTGAPVFAKAGTYRLKVRFQGAESAHVTVTIAAAADAESEAVKVIQAGKLHRYWGTIPEKDEFRPEVAENLQGFLEKHAASRFRPLASFALAQYWIRYDKALAAKESAEAAQARRERIPGLFADAATTPVIATECDFGRGMFHLTQGHGKSALEFLEAAVKKGDAQEWMRDSAKSQLEHLKKRKEAKDPALDWNR